MSTLENLASDLNMTKKQAAIRIEEVWRLYQIEKRWFKMNFDDSAINTPYDFNKSSYEIMKVLLKAIGNYPLF